MRTLFTILFLAACSFSSCKKDNELKVTGTVIGQQGCFANSYLVVIDNPNFSKHPFLRPTTQSCVACFNCSNSVYIRLSPGLETPGTKIRFTFTGSEISCLSSSEAPDHISAVNVSKI